MKYLFSLLLAAVFVTGCDSFVEDVRDPIDTILDEQLNDPAQINFIVNGVQARFAQSHDNVTLLSDLLSDAAVYGRNSDATFPTFQEIDLGEIELDNNSVDGLYGTLGEYRLLADQLVTRIGIIKGQDLDDTQMANANNAQFLGYLHGGIARYFYAAYFGANPQQGGSPLFGSTFYPSSALYDSALVKLDLAAAAVGSSADASYNTKLINSLKARIALYTGDFAQARTLASQGLKPGDAPFTSRHNNQSANNWFNSAYKTAGGDGRLQVAVAERFRGYVQNDSSEAARVRINAIVLSDARGTNGTDYTAGDIVDDATVLDAASSEPFQDLYASRDAAINFMSWQETALIQAEATLRAGNAGAALSLVNSVRDSYGIDDLGSIDLGSLATERDKELFGEGARLIDQRRLDVLPWHLPEDTWRYLPVTDQERNNNPCVAPLVGQEPNQPSTC